MKTEKVSAKVGAKNKFQSFPLEKSMRAPVPAASGSGVASQLDLDYIYGGTIHCLWASVNGKSYYKWMNDDQIKSIVLPAFQASQVYIQYNSQTLEIERIRPIKKF